MISKKKRSPKRWEEIVKKIEENDRKMRELAKEREEKKYANMRKITVK